MPIRPVARAPGCRHCGRRGHKARRCPLLAAGAADADKVAKAISCMAWIPQGAGGGDSRRPPAAAHPQGEAEDPTVEMLDASDSGSEADYAITETDFLYVAGKADQRREEYFVYVMVYDYETDRQFERQDIILSHPPLNLSWLDFSPSGLKGSYVAVCTMLPVVEIFDLGRKDDLRSVCTLGGAADPDDQYKVPDAAAPIPLRPGSHTSSVLACDWNRNEPSVLATGSADQSIKLWDLTTAACACTLNVHRSEVLAVRWHPQDRMMLLSSGLHDHSVVLSRVDQPRAAATWPVGCTAECAVWHPHHEHLFAAGTADGHVRVFDARKNEGAVYSFRAHPTGECSCIAFNGHIEGLMATGSNDRHIALWDVRHGHQEIVRRELGVGEVFALEFNPNNPFLLLGGGSTAEELVWTVTEDIRPCDFRLATNAPSSSSSS